MDELPLFLDLLIRVGTNGKFLNRIQYFALIVQPTEHINVRCEFAAAVILPSLDHFLQLKPYVSLGIITVAYPIKTTSSKEYKTAVHWTHLWMTAIFCVRCFNCVAAERIQIILGVPFKHPKFCQIAILILLEYQILFYRARMPVFEIVGFDLSSFIV